MLSIMSPRLPRTSLTRLLRQSCSFTQAPRLAKRRRFALSAGAAAGTLLPPPLLPSIAPSLLPLILALVLLHAADQEAQQEGETAPLPVSQNVPYRVTSITGAGLGARAIRDIERGEIVITDAPLLVWPQGISNEEADQLAARLLPEARRRFEALSNAQAPERGLNQVLGIRATNGFAVTAPKVPEEMNSERDLQEAPETVSFLYPNIARINHSCSPNADHAVDWSTLRMTVYASSPIAKGSEICIEYSPMVLKPRVERQAFLKTNFGFECSCRVCAAAPAEVARSDARRQELAKLADLVAEKGQAGSTEGRKAVIVGLERMRLLLEEEGYRALPEFDNESVSKAFVMYVANRAQFQELAEQRDV